MPKKKANPEHYSIEEAAEKMGVNTMELRNLLTEHKIHYHIENGRIRIKKDYFDYYLKTYKK